jgi:predicted nucleic acid-binding protein
MTVLLDTGSLVALLDRRQQHHQWAINQIKQLVPPLMTCGAVLSEALFLLRQHGAAIGRIRHFLRAEIIQLASSEASFAYRAMGLMELYSNVPMSYADGCLVAIAEQTQDGRVFTTDRHFLIYRMRRNQPVPAIIPER